MLSLKNYGSSSEDSSSSEDEEPSKKVPKTSTTNKAETDSTLHLKPPPSSASTSMALAVVAAPAVAPNETMDPRRHIDPGTKEVSYNPKYEDMFAPMIGPDHPFKTETQKADKNTLSGKVEPAHLNEFQFELQRRTFHSYGFAQDPSNDPSQELIGSSEGADSAEHKTVFEDNKIRPKDKRKRDRNDDPSDIDGYLGPWAKFKDEELVSKPSEEDQKYLDEYLAKMKKRTVKQTDEVPMEEKAQLHIKDPTDYQGRSFLHIPQDVGVNLKSEEAPVKCFIPKRQIHEWKGHTKSIACIKWFPKSAHLLLSGAMDNQVKLWEVYKNRRCIMTYKGHKQAIKDCDFNNSGDHFLSTSYDRYIKLWDTETGQCVSRFTNKKMGHCVKFNPDDDKQHLFVVGSADKKIVTWDTRSNEIVQEYDRHMGAVNTITFCDDNRRFVSTSDDKSMRVWEWDIPVDMKYIADPGMHSMPAVTRAPNQKYLACQSLDNKIVIYTCGDKFRPHKKKAFKGHMVAGYACSPDFSPDMSYVVSGDGDGKVCLWDWKTTKMLAKWKAHSKCVISVLWHPHETSKLATAGWDGVIKFWD